MPISPRRYDLDILRVGAFALLILYHLGMFYVPWGWHVKSDHLLPQLEPLMGAVNPWRLTLLFIISGAATRFMAGKSPSGELAAQRSSRLLVPLALGVLVVVPPQSWAEVVEKYGYTGSLLDFYPRYLSADQSFGDLILPTYNHLWFVAYLWVYTMVAIVGRPLAPLVDRIATRLLAGPGLFLVPATLFGLYRASAWMAWGETHNVFADAYGHLQYGTAFLLGLVMARSTEVWARLQDARMATAAAAAGLLALGLWLRGLGVEDAPGAPAVAFAALRETYAWMVIAALFGFARRYVTGGSPWLTLAGDAVFAFYIIHQTAIVVTGHLLKPLGLPVLAEAGIILAVTLASCTAGYALARAVPWLRLPLGLKPAAKRVTGPAVA